MARRHNINSNLLFGWRKHYREGVLSLPGSTTKGGFVPVAVIGEQGQVLPPAPTGKHPIKALPPSLPFPAPVPAAPKAVTASQLPAPRVPSGSIELHLSGKIKVRLEGDVDQTMLRHVLAAAREFT